MVWQKVTPLSPRNRVRVVSLAKFLRLRLELLHSLCSYLDPETALALEKRRSLGGRCSEMARVYAWSPWRSPINERPLSCLHPIHYVEVRMRIPEVRCGGQKKGAQLHCTGSWRRLLDKGI